MQVLKIYPPNGSTELEFFELVSSSANYFNEQVGTNPDTIYVSPRIYATAKDHIAAHLGTYDKLSGSARLACMGFHLLEDETLDSTEHEMEMVNFFQEVNEPIIKRTRVKFLAPGCLYTFSSLLVDSDVLVLKYVGIMADGVGRFIFTHAARIQESKFVPLESEGEQIYFRPEEMPPIYELSEKDLRARRL